MRIDEEARWAIRVGAREVIQLPAQLVRSVVEGSVSNGAFVTYATMFAISDDDLARPPEEIAEARGVSLRCFESHLDQLETAGWIDRGKPVLDQNGQPTRRILELRFTCREEAA